MNLKEITGNFIKDGCSHGNGKLIPNCEALHLEYKADLKKLGCKCRKKGLDIKWGLKLKQIISNAPEPAPEPAPAAPEPAPAAPEPAPAAPEPPPAPPTANNPFVGRNGKQKTMRDKSGLRTSKSKPFSSQ